MRLFVCALLLLTCSCTKEITTMERIIMINKTSHQINMHSWFISAGIGRDSSSNELAPGAVSIDTSITGQDVDIHDPYHFNYADSIRVIFNHTDSITHYAPQTGTFSGRSYPFSSTRNLLNIKSYKIEVSKGKRQFQTVTYTYTFTEQDYEDARK